MTPTSLLPGSREAAEHPDLQSEVAASPRVRAASRGRGSQLAAVLIVIIGVVLLAVGAFLVSYAGTRQIALAAGVSPTVAGIYPVIVDAVLVVACVAALALRGADWWMQAYAWLSVFFLLAAIGLVEAAHAAGISLSHRPAAAVMAALPWALFLLGFGLWLSMLRHQRKFAAANPAGRPDGASWWPWNAGLDSAEPAPLAAAPDPVVSAAHLATAGAHPATAGAHPATADAHPATADTPEDVPASRADAP
jgi:hypothetical protein